MYNGFEQRARQDSQKLKNDTACRLPATSAQCNIGTEKKPQNCTLLNSDVDQYSQGYVQIKEASRAAPKDNILQPYRSYDNFRSSNIETDDVGYNLYVFDKRYQQNFTASQLVKVEFKLDGVVPNHINGYVLVLTSNLVSISSDGQRQFDLN